MAESIFPHIKKAVTDFVYDQEGNIPRSKVLTIGSMLLVLGILLTDDAFAGHSSHKSHSSHASHSSHSSGSSGYHSSHASHTSHTSGSTHSNSHSSHSSSTVYASTPTPTPTPHSSHNNAAPSLAALNDIKSPDTGTVPTFPELPPIELPPDTTPLG